MSVVGSAGFQIRAFSFGQRKFFYPQCFQMCSARARRLNKRRDFISSSSRWAGTDKLKPSSHTSDKRAGDLLPSLQELPARAASAIQSKGASEAPRFQQQRRDF